MPELSADDYADKFRRGDGPPASEALPKMATPRWVSGLTRWLDDALVVPGTQVGVGLDAVLGALIPGAGDAVTAVASISLLWLGLRQRVPLVILARMVMNIAIDAVLGAVPVVGDIFDLFWKSNRKNLELLEKYRGDAEGEPGAKDYALVGAGMLIAVLAVLLPIFLITLIVTWVLR